MTTIQTKVPDVIRRQLTVKRHGSDATVAAFTNVDRGTYDELMGLVRESAGIHQALRTALREKAWAMGLSGDQVAALAAVVDDHALPLHLEG